MRRVGKGALCAVPTAWIVWLEWWARFALSYALATHGLVGSQ